MNSRFACLVFLLLTVSFCLAQEAPPEPPLYLATRQSVAYDGGIKGIPAGSKVTVISREGDQVTISVGGEKLTVNEADLTTDPNLGRQTEAAQREAQKNSAIQAQQALAEQRAKQRQEALDAEKDKAEKKVTEDKEGRVAFLKKSIIDAKIEAEKLYVAMGGNINRPGSPENRARKDRFTQLVASIQDWQRELDILTIVDSMQQKKAGQTNQTPQPTPLVQPVPGQPYPVQPVPGQPYPVQSVPGQPYPAQSVPGQPYPVQPVPVQPVPVQPVPVQPVPVQPVPVQPVPVQPVPVQPAPVQTNLPPMPGPSISAPPSISVPGGSPSPTSTPPAI